MIVQTGATAGSGASRLTASRARNLRRGSLSAFLLLLVQFVLGVYVNLYVTVPGADQGHGIGKALGSGPPSLILHIVIGLLLVLAALGFLVQAVLARSPGLIAAAAAGLIAMIGAAFAGSRFVGSGNDAASMLMAVLSVAGLLCYGISLYMLPAAPRAATEP